MIVLAWIGIVLLGLALVAVIIGFTMPQKTMMQREINVEADKKVIFELANNLQKFVENWSPWTEKDPNMDTEFGGQNEGVGAVYKWKGDPKKVGFGTMEIIESDPFTKVVSFLNFGGRGDAEVTLSIEEVGAGTCKVVWSFCADNGMNPMARIFGTMMDKFLGPDFEMGLRKLKEASEAKS